MSKFTKPNLEEIKQRQFEEVVFERVARELSGGVKKPGLWAKALAESHGDSDEARGLYIRLRAQSFLDEAFMEHEDAHAREENQTRAEKKARGRAKEKEAAAFESAKQNAERMRQAGGVEEMQGTYAGQLLFESCIDGTRDGVEQAMAFGIPVDLPNEHKQTALHLASGNGHADIVQFLLQIGADSNLLETPTENCRSISLSPLTTRP